MGANEPLRLGQRGRADEAITRFEQQLVDQTQELGPDARDTLTTRHHLAGSFAVSGQLDEAVTGFELLLADQIRVLGRDDPHTLGTWNDLGEWLVTAGRLEEGIRAFEQVLAAYRELREEVGFGRADVVLEQLKTYGAPQRDPRMRVVTVAWLGLGANLPEPTAGSDAAAASWVPVRNVLRRPKELAFDHAQILGDGLERARSKIEYSTLATLFCPEPFTVGDLREVYEAVWGVELDPGNFHRKVTAPNGFLIETGERTKRAGGRPAMLYRAGSAEQLLRQPILRPTS
jgi:8-oxo-dGTP diphosphatase